MKLPGKIALVSGASSGIGMATAVALSEEGARVLLLARRRSRLEELSAHLPNEHHIMCCDVRHREEVELAIQSLPEQWKSIEILVNNAGLARGLSMVQEGDVDDWEEMIDTNIKGLLYLTRAVLPGMVERKSGTIVNIASVAGRTVYPKGNVYCATKAAVRTLGEAMQYDVNGTGVRVCNIDPGMVETEFSLVRFRGNTERASQTYRGVEALSAQDVAEAVVFCATRPPHVSIQDILIMPTAQASPHLISRKPQ